LSSSEHQEEQEDHQGFLLSSFDDPEPVAMITPPPSLPASAMLHPAMIKSSFYNIQSHVPLSDGTVGLQFTMLPYFATATTTPTSSSDVLITID